MEELEIFNYSERAISILDDIDDELNIAAKDIKNYLNDILRKDNKSRIGIVTRIKSKQSLKGKIFRDKYFEQFEKPEDVIDFLSDLIGVRIECRFNSDEDSIYNSLLAHFDLIDENGLYFNESRPNILLDLEEKQPQVQNNGFKIYKIDGFYYLDNLKMNFELQIKSLVNVFWSEIEHEIIYKNNDYNIWDNFFEEILGSIKQNLSMIDKQLKILDDHFNKIGTKDLGTRQLTLEKTLSQMIYTMFSNKMKKSMGFVVNFNKSCDSIVKYLFRSQGADNLNKYQKTFSKTFSTLNELENTPIDFKKKLVIERKPIFVGSFTKVIGERILEKIVCEFDWVVFFRILFEIETGNNVEDFETYLEFLKYRFSTTKELTKISEVYGNEFKNELTDSILMKISEAFLNVDRLEFLYDSNLEKINSIISDLINIFFYKAKSFEIFKENLEVLLYLIEIEIESYFDKNTDMHQIKQVVRFLIKNSNADIIPIEDVHRYLEKDFNETATTSLHFGN
ncbi:MAG TPA: RelA/SpoT domain-containing protein [Clostridia bacterium]|nr:RelA/SpoT domain-containing protein [Clostridia bacterium]